MRLQLNISPRGALAAPTDETEIHLQSAIVMTASICSLLGAGWIILSFVCFKTLRSFRHQLILGLAISDFLMAVNFLSSTAMNVSGRYIGAPEQQAFCTFNGFVTQLFVIQTDYWVLIIAACTYFILAGHSRLSSWAEVHPRALFCLPWALTLLWAGIGLKVAGYGDIGAWCWFTSDRVRLFVNFVPRWIIILAILAMYLRLCFILHLAHKSLMSFGHSSSNPPGTRDVHGTEHSDHQLRDLSYAGEYNAGPGRHPPEINGKRLKKIAQLMLMYPLAYMLIWTLPTTVRIYQTTKGVRAPFALQTIDKCCIVLQGTIDAIIYGMNEACLSRWRELFSSGSSSFTTGVSVVQPGDTHHRNRHSTRSSHLQNTVAVNPTSSLESILPAARSITRSTGNSVEVETIALK
ncbi:hypothetical protein B0T10DRAFT_402115 [Thelonectria olida]|uniref:G-protein coupled receptors family 2 profile 2 domain-containing protein n=1 Tax=Thelonectria olida TaxID=1576542 RepID=A0A9P8WAF9_9HYPO|nr:hypothetical protein B0T10DRAFT_402115 [Thelonectria olida]